MKTKREKYNGLIPKDYINLTKKLTMLSLLNLAARIKRQRKYSEIYAPDQCKYWKKKENVIREAILICKNYY